MEKSIKTVILEGHYIYREANKYYRDFFNEKGIAVMFRCGVETFDESIREGILRKGLPGVTPEDIAGYYDWINLMYGMDCQTITRLKEDMDIGLKYFKRINLSIYTTVKNGPGRDEPAIRDFYGSDFYKELKANPVIDIFDEWDENNGHNVGHDIY